MRVQLTISLILVITLLTLVGCSTKNIGDNVTPGRQVSDFSINVLDSSYYGGASVQNFQLETKDYGNDVVVSIQAEGASDLKALYFDLSYDANNYRPLNAEPSYDLNNRSDMLTLSVLKDRGTVHYGQVLANPDWRVGFTGNGEVATVMFRKEATPALRAISTVSVLPLSAAPLTFDGTNLDWYYAWQGDYDQNGETNASDLTPLGLHFGETGFSDTSAAFMIDGDANGEINASDITPIGLNFGHSALGGYNVYHSLDIADYPASNGAPNGAGAALLENVAFSSATGNKATDRLAFTSDATSAPANSYFWVRATDPETSGEGTPSNYVGGNPAEQPVLALTNPPAGGDGTSGNPYVADTSTDYVFSLTDPSDGDVSTDANTTYTVSDVAAGSIAAGSSTLNIEDAYTGTFHVTAVYNGKPNRNDTTIYMTVGTPAAGIDIYPDPADTDWSGVTGDGSSGTPYVMHVDGGFNDDYSTEFSLKADDDTTTHGESGNDIPVGDLTWAINPPFLVTWVTDGTFQANLFTSNYVFAQDVSMNESNHLYVISQSLPN